MSAPDRRACSTAPRHAVAAAAMRASCEARRRGRPKGCGHDAALGQRFRVAHMPTAATVAREVPPERESQAG
jgi:hypothetical protein